MFTFYLPRSDRCKRLHLVLLAFFIAFGAYTCRAQSAPEKQILNDYLLKVGSQFDCYFTIEADKRSFAPLVYVSITDVENIDDLVQKLQNQLPNMVVQRSLTNPVVIHLSDRTLANVAQYPISQTFAINYNGKIAKLPNVIGAGLNGALVQQYANTLPIIFSDSKTLVSFRSTTRIVRDLLSAYVPLSDYARVLWKSKTLNFKNVTQSQVFYLGPVDMEVSAIFKRYDTSRKVDFADGEYVYRGAPFSDQNATDAIAFINERMASKSQLNVRWAMFYLGKHKVERGVPTLLKYIDYQYTTTPLIEEAYPALRALRQIGKPASDAALTALSNEKDAKRLRLLLRVVMSVNGLDGGQKLVDAALPNIKELAQRNRVAAELATVVKQIPNDATATVPDEDDS